jgi:hypothetical protein
MGAFSDGFRNAGDMYDSSEKIKLARQELGIRLKESDSRLATEALGRDTASQALGDQRRLSAATGALADLGNPKAVSNPADLAQTYGMNADQLATAYGQGGATGLKAKLASYDVPDSYDLQDVNTAPKPTAVQLGARSPTSVRDMIGAAMTVAALKGDTATHGQLTDKLTKMDYSDAKASGLKTNLDAIAKDPSLRYEFAKDLTSNAMPITVAGIDPKTKAWSLNIQDPSGKSRTLVLPESKIAEAHALTLLHQDPRFADMATADLDKIDATFGNLVKAHNDVTAKSAEVGNQGTTAGAHVISANAAMASAGAAGLAARGAMIGHVAQANYYNAHADQLNGKAGQEKLVGDLAGQYAGMSDDDQKGAPGQAVARAIAVARAKLTGIPGVGAPKERKVGSVLKNADGGGVALDDNNQPMWNLTATGQKIPLGMTEPDYKTALVKARDAGVMASVGTNGSGETALVYMGADNKPYDNLREAVGAKAPKAGLATPQSAASAAPVPTDPMAIRAAQESSAINRGQIYDLSPEVKQYLAERQTSADNASDAKKSAYANGLRRRDLDTARAYNTR